MHRKKGLYKIFECWIEFEPAQLDFLLFIDSVSTVHRHLSSQECASCYDGVHDSSFKPFFKDMKVGVF